MMEVIESGENSSGKEDWVKKMAARKIMPRRVSGLIIPPNILNIMIFPRLAESVLFAEQFREGNCGNSAPVYSSNYLFFHHCFLCIKNQ